MTEELSFYVEVTVDDTTITIDGEQIAGHKGVVVGKMRDDESVEMFYTVLLSTRGETVVVSHDKVVPTGRKFAREDIYPSDTFKVVVDSETGEGRAKE